MQAHVAAPPWRASLTAIHHGLRDPVAASLAASWIACAQGWSNAKHHGPAHAWAQLIADPTAGSCSRASAVGQRHSARMNLWCGWRVLDRARSPSGRGRHYPGASVRRHDLSWTGYPRPIGRAPPWTVLHRRRRALHCEGDGRDAKAPTTWRAARRSGGHLHVVSGGGPVMLPWADQSVTNRRSIRTRTEVCRDHHVAIVGVADSGQCDDGVGSAYRQALSSHQVASVHMR